MTDTALDARARAAIPAFLYANFVIGTGVVLLPGMLNELASGLAVTLPQAGQLVTVAAVLMAIGAPALASLTSRVDRRTLLVAALWLYALGHVASALAPGFGWLMVVRTIAMLAPAIYTPQAAATIGLLVPPQRRSSAVATIFLGWSIASIAGMPVGSLIGAHVSWRAGFGFVAVLAAIAAVWVARVTPRGLHVPPVSLSAWGRALGNRRLTTTLAVTLTSAGGQFVMFTFLAPTIAAFSGGGPNRVAALLAVYGVAGVIGNTWVSRRIDRLGADAASTACQAVMAASMLAWGIAGLGSPLAWPALLAGCIGWGLGCFAGNSAQQARLVVASPSLASVSIALNTSCMYAGQAVGTALGAMAITIGGLPLLPWVAAAVIAAAIAVSRIAAHQPLPSGT